jgi:hypothetical protein
LTGKWVAYDGLNRVTLDLTQAVCSYPGGQPVCGIVGAWTDQPAGALRTGNLQDGWITGWTHVRFNILFTAPGAAQIAFDGIVAVDGNAMNGIWRDASGASGALTFVRYGSAAAAATATASVR